MRQSSEKHALKRNVLPGCIDYYKQIQAEQLLICNNLQPGMYIVMCATYMAGLEGEVTLSISTTTAGTDQHSITLTQLWPPLTAAQQKSTQVNTTRI
jgi:hypothetical protein